MGQKESREEQIIVSQQAEASSLGITPTNAAALSVIAGCMVVITVIKIVKAGSRWFRREVDSRTAAALAKV